MREYALIVLVTAAVTYLLTPLVRRLAIAGGAIHAARDRDVHIVPIPLLGGLAIYGGVAAGLMVAGQVTPLRTVLQDSPRMASGLLLAGGLIALVGVIDDRWGLGPIIKLAGQVGAGGATINAVNFIDGLDGLAAGIVCIAAIAFFVYSYRLTQVVQPRLSDLGNPALASAVLVGACVGFLPHNFYPARIFMGDTGSMLLGLLLAYVPISSIASVDPATLPRTVNRFPEVLPLLLPAAILVIPYADLLLAVVRRTRAGQSPLVLMSMPRLRWWERGRQARAAAARSLVADQLAARSAVAASPAGGPGGSSHRASTPAEPSTAGGPRVRPEDVAPRAASGVSARPR